MQLLRRKSRKICLPEVLDSPSLAVETSGVPELGGAMESNRSTALTIGLIAGVLLVVGSFLT